jgi:putative addiction module killer protein/probable addiction module antidote protein
VLHLTRLPIIVGYNIKARKDQALTRIVNPKQIVLYADEDGNEPFQAWIDSLRDPKSRRRIISRLFRVQQGNYGDVKPIGDGLSELRIFFGPGYRVYFGEDAGTLLLSFAGAIRIAKAAILRTLKLIGRSIKAVRTLRTLDEFTERYFRDHPEEVDDYLMEIFQDFAEDNDTGALLASLRVIARVRGISDMAQKTGMTRQGLQKALSSDGNPRLGNVISIMKAMGYYLVPQKLPSVNTSH